MMPSDKLRPRLDFGGYTSFGISAQFALLNLLAERFDVELGQERVVDEGDTKVDRIPIRNVQISFE